MFLTVLQCWMGAMYVFPVRGHHLSFPADCGQCGWSWTHAGSAFSLHVSSQPHAPNNGQFLCMWRYIWEFVWKASQHYIFLRANAVPCLAFWNLMSSVLLWCVNLWAAWGRQESCLQGGVALRTVPKQAAGNLCPRGMHHRLVCVCLSVWSAAFWDQGKRANFWSGNKDYF